MDQPLDPHTQPDYDDRFKSLIEHFAGDAHCPLCGERYAREGIRVVRQHEHRWTVSVQCHCCGSGSLITAALPENGLPEHDRADGLFSQRGGPELTPGEAHWFAAVAPITGEDVLDWHVYLQHFHGDFTSMG